MCIRDLKKNFSQRVEYLIILCPAKPRESLLRSHIIDFRGTQFENRWF